MLFLDCACRPSDRATSSNVQRLHGGSCAHSSGEETDIIKTKDIFKRKCIQHIHDLMIEDSWLYFCPALMPCSRVLKLTGNTIRHETIIVWILRLNRTNYVLRRVIVPGSTSPLSRLLAGPCRAKPVLSLKIITLLQKSARPVQDKSKFVQPNVTFGLDSRHTPTAPRDHLYLETRVKNSSDDILNFNNFNTIRQSMTLLCVEWNKRLYGCLLRCKESSSFSVVRGISITHAIISS